MPAQKNPRTCIYCGGNVGRTKKGEHIVPAAIGGALAIKTVCESCNNAFSGIDAELCSRSPLSVVASQVIDAHLWQVWDVDHSANNLLLEARPDWSHKSLTQYPQIVFEQPGPQLRGDFEEMRRFGSDQFAQVLVKCARQAFRHAEAGEPRWVHLERIEANQAIARGYRLPPRIFARHSIAELANRLARRERTSCVLRYQTDADRRFALNALDNWRSGGRFNHYEVGIGSALPAMRCFYDAGKTLRALAKIAINILAHCCPNTPVNRIGFENVVRVITGELDVPRKLLRANGFVRAADIAPLGRFDGGHSFRLMHMDGHWHVYAAFFGGRIGSFVRFPGPNGESWCRADVHAPLKSKQWTIQTGSVLQPLRVHIEWRDPSTIIPLAEMVNPESELRVIRVPRAHLK